MWKIGFNGENRDSLGQAFCLLFNRRRNRVSERDRVFFCSDFSFFLSLCLCVSLSENPSIIAVAKAL